MIDRDEIFKILEENNCNPKYIKIRGLLFSRTIEFETKYVKCWVDWWINISYLSVGDRYANQFPFTKIEQGTTHPSNKTDLLFYYGDCRNFNKTFSLTLEKLDWQETKQGE